MAGRLNDRVAVVTGSSRGIGKGIAKFFAAEGVKVLVVARDETAGNVVVGEIQQPGGEAAFCRAASSGLTPYFLPAGKFSWRRFVPVLQDKNEWQQKREEVAK